MGEDTDKIDWPLVLKGRSIIPLNCPESVWHGAVSCTRSHSSCSLRALLLNCMSRSH